MCRERENWRAGKHLRSVCPVHLLPLHNLWTAGADHHGSAPPATPEAMWDRPVNWMLCSCWACKVPFFNHPASEADQLQAQAATFELCRAPDQQKKKEMEAKKREKKMALLSVKLSPGCQSLQPFPSLPSSSNRQPPAPPYLPTRTHTLTVPTPARIPPSAFFITDSSASLHLSHMHRVEACQSPIITLISW